MLTIWTSVLVLAVHSGLTPSSGTAAYRTGSTSAPQVSRNRNCFRGLHANDNEDGALRWRESNTSMCHIVKIFSSAVVHLEHTSMPNFSPPIGLCTGSVISEWDVLTAAHCVVLKTNPRFLMVVGIYYAAMGHTEGRDGETGEFLRRIPVASFHVHPNYTNPREGTWSDSDENDIAVLRLNESIFSGLTDSSRQRLSIVRLASDKFTAALRNQENAVFLFAGWGATPLMELRDFRNGVMHLGQAPRVKRAHLRIVSDTEESDASTLRRCFQSNFRRRSELCVEPCGESADVGNFPLGGDSGGPIAVMDTSNNGTAPTLIQVGFIIKGVKDPPRRNSAKGPHIITLIGPHCTWLAWYASITRITSNRVACHGEARIEVCANETMRQWNVTFWEEQSDSIYVD